MQNIINRNKKYLKFVFVIIVIGLISGFLYYHFLNSEVQENIINTIKDYTIFNSNYIFKDLIITSVILVSSFFIMGIPLAIFFLFYESISLGFLINIFFVAFKLKGLIYIALYILINRLLVFFLIILFLQKIINIGRLVIGIILSKNDKTIRDKLIVNFKNSIYIIIFILIINVIVYFVSPLIFKYLSFLLK